MPTNNDRGNGPETIGFWVVVPVAEHAAAERLAKLHAVEGLEEVGAAFVGVMAEAADRPDSPRVAWLHQWLTGHPWPRSGEGAPVPPELWPRLIPLDDLGGGDAAGTEGAP